MNKDNNNLIKYLGIIFIAVLLAYRLPHDSYSAIEYIIKPIAIGNSVLHLSGIVPLILFFIGIRGILYLEKFKDKNKVFMFLFIVFIIIPVMKWTLDITRTNYHLIMKDGLNAVDIIDSKINIGNNSTDHTLTINFNFKIIDYSRSKNEFKIRVYLHKALSDYTGKEFYEFENTYKTYRGIRSMDIREQITVKSDNNAEEQLFKTNWFWEDYQYEIFNENYAVRIKEHGQ